MLSIIPRFVVLASRVFTCAAMFAWTTPIQSPPSCPSPVLHPAALPRSRRTPCDAPLYRSVVVSARWWNDLVFFRLSRSPETSAVPANPPRARQSLARNRSLQNIPPAANENRFPAPATGAPASPRKTSRTPSRQTHRISSLPTIHSPAGRTDVLAPSPTLGERSTSAPAAVFVVVSPFPSAMLRKSAPHSTEILELWKLHEVTRTDFHHRLLAQFEEELEKASQSQ